MKYFLSNKGKTTAVVLVIMLAVFCVYFISSLIESVFQVGLDANIGSLSRFSLVTPSSDEFDISSDSWETIESCKSVDTVYDCIVETTYINNIFGQSSAFMVYLNDKNLKEIFEKCGFKIEKGRMPNNNEFEVIVHENMLKNKKLDVGDTFSISSGNYKIVGSYSGDSMLAFGVKSHSISQYEDLGADVSKIHFAGLIYPNENISDMNQNLDKIDSSEFDIQSTLSVQRDFNNQTKNINLIMTIIVFVVALCISAAISLVINTLYMNRIDEFGILNAIGYSKKRIIVKKIIIEVFSLVSLSWIFGLVVSFALLQCVNINIFEPMGQAIPLFSLNSLRYTILSLLIIVIVSIVPICNKLSKADLVAVIEKR